MEQILDVIGATALVLLIVIGAAVGLIAGQIAGRRKLLYFAVGVAGAVALPFILAALGLGVLAASGLLVLGLVALVGALLLLALVRAVTGRHKG